MRNISKYTYDYIKLYNDVIRNKKKVKKGKRVINRKAYLEKIEKDIVKAYQDYEKYKDNLINIPNLQLTKPQKEALLNLYENKSPYFQDIYMKIKKSLVYEEGNICPYCGIGEVATLDHYLPKEDFPQYSIFPPNLIPCCWNCNHLKRKKWKHNGRRLFVHVYYDTLPKERFLFATINHLDLRKYKLPCFKESTNPNSKILSFKIDNKIAKIEPDLIEVINNHYSELKLFDRFYEEISKPINQLIREIRNSAYALEAYGIANIDIDVDVIKRSIARNLEKERERSGYYHWTSAVKYALLEEKDLLTFIIKNEL